jgi:orotate phosphoribosyltransferase
MDNPAVSNPVVSWLFETDAVRVCPEGRPYWYTSGKLGPIYINTHFLCGGEEVSLGLLHDIEAEASRRPIGLPGVIGDKLHALMQTDERYGQLIAQLVERAKDAQSAEGIDVISGGERRDFFFSLPVARALRLPHVSISKNLFAVYSDAQNAAPATREMLEGKRALHVADLVTEASSFSRAWIPAVERLGARIVSALAVVDRDQGGREALEKAGIPLRALVKVDAALFDGAAAQGKLTAAQCGMARDFLASPEGFMRGFLRAYPNFLQEQIALGGRAKERAERCIAMGFDK